jgi:hypothetical protein
MTFVRKWLELGISMLNKVSQTLRDKYCMFCLICRTQIFKKVMKVEARIFGKKNGSRRKGDC